MTALVPRPALDLEWHVLGTSCVPSPVGSLAAQKVPSCSLKAVRFLLT